MKRKTQSQRRANHTRLYGKNSKLPKRKYKRQ